MRRGVHPTCAAIMAIMAIIMAAFVSGFILGGLYIPIRTRLHPE